MMHIVDVVLITFAVLVTISGWAMVGFVVLLLIEGYESKYDHLLSCFLWPIFIMGWVVLALFDNDACSPLEKTGEN